MIKQRSFQQKVQWFKLKIQELKTSWTKGSEKIYVDRHNILASSFDQLSKIDLTKEIKVNFTDQKKEQDAGGIFRQWLNLSMKQLFGNQFGLFSLCNTQQAYYKVNFNEQIIKHCSKNANLLGYIIAKALMERVPINCHLNFTIWRQILQQKITLDDIYTYDKQFYQSWKYILQNKGTQELDLNFTILLYDKVLEKNILIKIGQNGKQIQVTDQNKQEYISKVINLMCVKMPYKAIMQIKRTLFQIIPYKYLSIFEPYEIDAFLCGQETIDVQDWKQNTEYDGYTKDDIIIEWFWKIVQNLDQKMLKNLLHYCTGCSRVPVSGFKYLQSNRGQIKLFNIRKSVLKQFNQCPISFTCFNRLQLPQYADFDQLSAAIISIAEQEINHINHDA